MTIDNLLEALLTRFPAEDAEEWDHIGLSVGDPSDRVRGVLVSLDVTPESIDAAQRAGANVLLTHHPVYLKAPSAFVPRSDQNHPLSSETLYKAIKAGVTVISLHTNLDRSIEARKLLASMLEVSTSGSLEHPDDARAKGYGMVSGAVELSLSDLAVRAARAFNTDPRVWGRPSSPVRRLSMLGGSLGDFGDHALACGADAVICGEAGYHVCQDLAARGLGIILLGHDTSEQPFTKVLADAVHEIAGEDMNVTIFDPPRQWWTVLEGVR